mgnify:CR=1 FL=1|jgi:transposase|tara:strand:+ start:235 stop:453 length:219 start_codon:yes stop_codon:yes gene_type:complete
MRQTTGTRKSPGEKLVKDIKRATRKQYSSEEKIRIVLDGLRGEDSIAELCRREKPWYLVGSGWQAKVERVKQ